MNTTIEDIDTTLRALKPNQYELTQTIAGRTTMSTVKVGLALAEARRRGWIATKESVNKGYREHVIQNKGYEFLQWTAAGRLDGYI